MKIEKITLCNITSFEGEHVIDFNAEPLQSASLYAVTGDTGAGKSTLLDAICLALYDSAPRLDDIERTSKDELNADGEDKSSIQANDTRNVIRHGQKHAYCRVVFSMPDGASYEAEWSCRMKKTGRLDAVSRKLVQLSPHKKTIAQGTSRAVQPVIDETTGLDYMQFSRTVMLAQGSFATFLQARRGEKSALLEKLTGTEIYGRISEKIYQQTTDAEMQLREIESLRQGILAGCMEEAELKEVETDLHQKESQHAHLQERIETLKTQLQWLADYEKMLAHTDALEKKCQQANKTLLDMDDMRRQLEIYDHILPAQPICQQVEFLKRNQKELLQKEQETTAQLKVQNQKCEEAHKERMHLGELCALAQRNLDVKSSDLRHGHTLTGELKMAEKQIATLQQQKQQGDANLEEVRKYIAEKRQEIAEAEKQQKELLLHHQHLAPHHVMFEKIELVRDKLTSLLAESQREKAANAEIAALQKKQEETASMLHSAEEKQQAAEVQLNALRGDLAMLRKVSENLNGEELEQEVHQLQQRLVTLSQASSLWKRIVAGYEQTEALDDSVRRNTADVARRQKELERERMELDRLFGRYENIREAYTLSNSHNIVSLRKKLKEGTPCPVCGAAHHPYHTETERELGEIIGNLEKDWEEIQALYRNKQQRVEELANTLANMSGTLHAERESLKKALEAQRTAEEEWEPFSKLDPSLAGCSPSADRVSRQAMLNLLTDSCDKLLRERQQEFQTFNQTIRKTNDISSQIEALMTRMNLQRANLDDLRTSRQVNRTTIDSLQQTSLRSSEARKQIYNDLNEMVTISGWFARWEQNPDAFRGEVVRMSQEWTATTAALDDTQKKLGAMREEVLRTEVREREAARQAAELQENISAVAEGMQSKRDELRRMFGGLSPEEEETRLHTELRRAKQLEDAAADRLAAEKSARTRLETILSEITAHLDATRRQIAAGEAELHAWLTKNAFQGVPLRADTLGELFASTTDWPSLRKRVDDARRAASLAAADALAARGQLMEHGAHSPFSGQLPQTPQEISAMRDAANAETADATRSASQLAAAILALQTRISTHHSSLREAASQQQALDDARRSLLEWRRLNSLLGSADGKRFRQLAQCLTFRTLVQSANACLRQLSPRYELRNPLGTLILEVSDRYMFDQRRYASSLSGGETFVVSLALALALAQISAGSLAIRSLFIDEGFGNLDQASLDLVMQTLERLETHQGRKVGIISHTLQIRQQISPQIHIVKQAATGRSTIAIY